MPGFVDNETGSDGRNGKHCGHISTPEKRLVLLCKYNKNSNSSRTVARRPDMPRKFAESPRFFLSRRIQPVRRCVLSASHQNRASAQRHRSEVLRLSVFRHGASIPGIGTALNDRTSSFLVRNSSI